MYKRVRNEVVTNAKSSVTCRYIMFCVCVVCMHNVLRWQWAKICREYICITKLKFIKDTRQDKLQLQSISVWPMIECQSCVVSFQFTLLYMCVYMCVCLWKRHVLGKMNKQAQIMLHFGCFAPSILLLYIFMLCYKIYILSFGTNTQHH